MCPTDNNAIIIGNNFCATPKNEAQNDATKQT